MAYSKYRNQPVIVDGIRFDSKAEARYYSQLKIRKLAGDIKFFLRQVPFDLPGGVKYRLDFMVFENDDTVRCVDVKGTQTQMFKLKKKQVESLYPVEIELVK